MGNEFISWIPCISGDLFFSKTAFGLGAYDFYLTNISIRNDDGVFQERSLLASSIVDWQDTDFLSEPNRGLYRVVVDAHSTEYTSLLGSVYLLEKNSNDKSNLSKRPKFLPRENCSQESMILEHLHALKQNYASLCSVQQNSAQHQEFERSKSLIQEALESISSTVVHKINFEIHQTGIMLSRADYTKANGELVSTNYYERRRLCSQAFYYLKFLLHKHAHHSNENETLTTVHRIKNRGIDNAQILIRDLKRGLVDAKRAGRSTRHTASGIAAYGASLVQTCESLGWFDKEAIVSNSIGTFCSNNKADQEKDYLKNVGTSLELINNEQIAAGEKSAKSSFWRTYTVCVLWLLGVVGPILVYINIFSNGYFGAKQIENLRVNRVKVNGDIVDQLLFFKTQYCDAAWPGLSYLCNLGIDTLMQYASGQVSSAISIVLFMLFLSFIPAGFSPDWGKYNLSGKCSNFCHSYIAQSAYSLASKNNWQYRITVAIIIVKKIFVALYQPKISDGLRLQWIAICIFSAISVIAIYWGLKTTFNVLF
ncbi:hypothetical protein [Granulosicoccus antarcticus]|uniref:Uncharacterized protein n=1 Tax=Granulosicoccus antarcticus IMCC3135 TaxID=1192854 RepID=A0A2Z2P0Y0_9GAMM|nr:hypothetical protein [Granulosicoccus antarcticus]ASJ76445.1 hypothetical protein IMCC3135_31990 [Granulosicoccus antarcticus IMCC3135]